MGFDTRKMRGRPVTSDEAAKSVQRLINSHFHNKDSARCSIPVRADDDDIVASDYVLDSSEQIAEEDNPPRCQHGVIVDRPCEACDAAPVQPSGTEDVVERMCDAFGCHYSSWSKRMAAALAVARAGLHSWKSVEKAIRAEFVHQFKSSYAHELGGILYGVQRLLSQQDAKAEPAERVTQGESEPMPDTDDPRWHEVFDRLHRLENPAPKEGQ